MLTTSLFCLAALAGAALAGPYAPAAGVAGSTAIYKDDPAFVGWATGYQNYLPGPNVDPEWQTPQQALGKADGASFDDNGSLIVSLGDSGQITLTFARPITDGPGFDFAVFENAFDDYFLELAWVEVSSDGVNFFRFENHSLTDQPVPFIGAHVDPTNIDGLASKYRIGYGTPFDLSQLAGTPGLDVRRITHVRIVDIVGDGSCLDSTGHPIYDPYPTTGSGGFDLDAVGVLHQLLPGDANADGQVSVGDLGILAANYGKADGAAWGQGDFNGDGAVSVGDLGILAANYGSSQAVPEPGTLALLIAGGVMLRRRQRLTAGGRTGAGEQR